MDGDVRLPTTQYALDRATRYYRRRFGVDPESLPGTLAFENKLNFQREWYKLTTAGLPDDVAAVRAVAETSFGRHRAARGYSQFEVTIAGSMEKVDLGAPYGTQMVPTGINVIARKGP